MYRIRKNRRRRPLFDAPSSDERDMLYTGATERLDLTRENRLSSDGQLVLDARAEATAPPAN